MSRLLKDYSLLLGKTFALLIYALSFISVRSKRIWAFGSETGYDGNSKYLLQYLLDNHPEIRSYWISKRKNECQNLRRKGINAFYAYSLRGIYYCLRAGIYIVTGSLADINFYTSGKCKYIQLWHGIGLKCCLWSNKNSSMNKNGKIIGFIKRPSFYIEPHFILGASKMMNQIFASMFRANILCCYSFLYPRCIPLLSTRDNLIKYVKRWEGINVTTIIDYLQNYKSVLLYMPTYRDHNPHFLSNQGWNLDILNHLLIDNNYLLLIKLHPSMEYDINFEGYSNIKELDKNIDIYPIMPFTHVLITDYSSIYYDYILMEGKKIILYVPDKIDYKNSRDLLMDYDENCKGLVAENFEELLCAIKSNEVVNYEDLRNKFWGKSINTNMEELFAVINNLAK